MRESEKWKWSCSIVFDSEQPHGLQPTRLLCPWDLPGKSSGVGCHCLLLSLGGLKYRPFFSHSFGVWGVQDQGASKFSFWWESLPSWQPSASWMYTHSHGKDRESPSALEVVRQYHRLNGHEFDQTLGDSGRQRSLVCYSPWSHKELDVTWQLNDNSHIMTSTLMTSSSPNYCLKAPHPNYTGA